LGAGGGGAVFIFSKDKDSMDDLKDDVSGSFTEIPSKIRSKGHDLLNL
jgi:D-glycero-alpha-D-manno-heptose-7-phosphate kinase